MHMKRYFPGIAALIVIIALCAIPASAAYAHNESIWSSSHNQFVYEGTESNLISRYHYNNAFNLIVKPGVNVIIQTPFTAPYNKDGINLKARYLYFSLEMPVGVNVTHVAIANGHTTIYTRDVNWAGTGDAKVYTLNMGAWYNVNRGINANMNIVNSLGSNQNVQSYGAGVKLEW